MKSILIFIIFSLACLLTPQQSSAQAQDTIRIFLLSGQSNMQGWGLVSGVDEPGTLEHTLANNSGGIYDSLTNDAGGFAVRNDVWISHNNADDEVFSQQLTANQGGYFGYIGPELGFGTTLGGCIEDDVLLIKAAWGGKSLAVDFRPPSAGGATGPFYNQMVDHFNEAIADMATNFPQFAGRPYTISGLGWHQGWNDGEEDAYMAEYEQNLIHLINDLRAAFDTPNMPVVVGNTGQGGFEVSTVDLWIQGLQTQLVPAQQAATEHPPFAGTVALADTRPFWPTVAESPSDAAHHWHDNAHSYLRIGEAMALQMIELLDKDIAVDTEEIPQEIGLRIYPNPASDIFTLHSEEDAGSLSVEIYNIQGQLVRRASSLMTPHQLNISTLPTGTYQVVVRDNQQRSKHLRLVKQ